MPDLNGTAVVMKCADVSELEQYLCFLSLQLNQAINFLNFFNTNIIITMNTGQFSTLSLLYNFNTFLFSHVKSILFKLTQNID